MHVCRQVKTTIWIKGHRNVIVTVPAKLLVQRDDLPFGGVAYLTLDEPQLLFFIVESHELLLLSGGDSTSCPVVYHLDTDGGTDPAYFDSFFNLRGNDY